MFTPETDEPILLGHCPHQFRTQYRRHTTADAPTPAPPFSSQSTPAPSWRGLRLRPHPFRVALRPHVDFLLLWVSKFPAWCPDGNFCGWPLRFVLLCGPRRCMGGRWGTGWKMYGRGCWNFPQPGLAPFWPGEKGFEEEAFCCLEGFEFMAAMGSNVPTVTSGSQITRPRGHPAEYFHHLGKLRRPSLLRFYTNANISETKQKYSEKNRTVREVFKHPNGILRAIVHLTPGFARLNSCQPILITTLKKCDWELENQLSFGHLFFKGLFKNHNQYRLTRNSANPGLPTVPIFTGVTGAANGRPSRPVEHFPDEIYGAGTGRQNCRPSRQSAAVDGRIRVGLVVFQSPELILASKGAFVRVPHLQPLSATAWHRIRIGTSRDIPERKYGRFYDGPYPSRVSRLTAVPVYGTRPQKAPEPAARHPWEREPAIPGKEKEKSRGTRKRKIKEREKEQDWGKRKIGERLRERP
ncbi:hypothetical protein FB451DRAFT_1175762 [Mycena latifolia]|nr:hypothetical protein FB451DRAFT_1175762 [Mycena latifolia]